MPGEILVEHGRHLWAKSDRDGTGHSLVGHLLDTGLVAKRLLLSRPGLEQAFVAEELGLEQEEACRLLAIMTALHDIGKATPVFQAKWPEGAPAEALNAQLADVPHGRASGIILHDWLLRCGYRKRLANSLANAVAIHHGRRLPANYKAAETFDPRSIGFGSSRWETWHERIADDVSGAFGGLPACGHRKYLRGRTWALLAGLASVADWIASSLPHAQAVTEPAKYIESRLPEVEERITGIGWPDSGAWYSTDVPGQSFEKLFFADFKPRPLQSTMADLAGGVQEPGLFVIEAPMGEGKTEAALFAAVQPAGRRGTYLALPTQATSDAMHARMTEFVRRHESRPLEISLAHSGAKLRTALPQAAEPVVAEAAEADREAQSWFSQGRRELLTVVGVGTVDQALLGILPVKHFFVRLWGLAGKTVILDEVHAYDTYTSELIAVLVEWLASVDCSIILMSATLPLQTRQQLLAAFRRGRGGTEGAAAELPADAQYPLIARADDGGVEFRSFTAEPRKPVELSAVPHAVEEVGALLESLVADGSATAAIVNTVGRAQELYEYCRGRGITATLLHGRMPLGERQRREQQVVARFGPAGDAAERKGLVIGTQVLEQSLDIDFDVMVSDLAPVDLLLQRAGRMHRHVGRTRPDSSAEPRLYIAGLAGNEPGLPDPPALETVYSKLIMLRTALVLADCRQLRLPGDLHRLVQTVYGEDTLAVPAELQAAMSEAVAEHESAKAADEQTAKTFSLALPFGPCPESWGEAGSDIDAHEWGSMLVPTRLFDESVVVVPLLSQGESWVLPDGSMAFPRNWRPGNPGRFAVAAFRQQLRIQRKSLLRRLKAEQVPDWWKKLRLIRYFVPLCFGEDGKAIVDDSIIWDAELGIVFAEGGTG